ncbi:MAG TPA: outer membrane beta-barrel protein [Bacteroidales bacterium]|nr:outer membrane beta-barrel protein [Bacteroidales bacterium]
MKKYIIISILAISAVFYAGTASAQMETHWEVEWDISLPTGSFNDFIDETSIRGIEFGGTYHFETNVTVGGSVGYGAFFKKTDRMTVEYNNNTVTAIHFRDLYSYSFLAEAGYAYQSDFFITPYARVGIGAYYTELVTQIGLLYWKDESWNFGLRPEVGALIQVPNSGIGFILNAKYNAAINYTDNLDNLNYLTFGVGFIFGF